ncbi:MAG: hypothetical protein WC551_08900 [Patescibacteria group bacterium]
MEPYKTIEFPRGIVAKIYPDVGVENPIREYDCEPHVQIWHRNYDFGNSKEFARLEDAERFFRESLQHRKGTSKVYWLPVYLYDHSGLTVSTGKFSCPWDSGQVGYCWFSCEEARDVWGMTPNQAKVEAQLKACVKLLDDYLTGNVYGYVIEDHEGNELDSCWGYFGDPEGNVIPEATVSAEYYVGKTPEQLRLAI